MNPTRQLFQERPDVYRVVLRLFSEEPQDRWDIDAWRQAMGDELFDELFSELDRKWIVRWTRQGRKLYPYLTLATAHQWRLLTRGIARSSNTLYYKTELDSFALPANGCLKRTPHKRRFRRSHAEAR